MELMDKHYIFGITSIFPLMLFVSSIFMNDIPQREENEENQANGNLTKIHRFFKFLKMPEIYKPIVFILFFMMTPTSSSSMFFFYTNELGFDPSFMGSLKFIHAAGNLLAVFIYNKYLKHV